MPRLRSLEPYEEPQRKAESPQPQGPKRKAPRTETASASAPRDTQPPASSAVVSEGEALPSCEGLPPFVEFPNTATDLRSRTKALQLYLRRQHGVAGLTVAERAPALSDRLALQAELQQGVDK